MKKILIVLAVLALAVPTMAAVTVAVVDNADFTGDITYDMTGEPNRVRAWALTVTVDSGAVITAVTPAVAGESTTGNIGFGIFPGTIVIDANAGVITDPNTPVAPATDPGAAGTGIGTSTVILEMGSLYVGPNFPADIGTLATITVDQACNATITAEVTFRGGIVEEDSTQVTGATLATNAPITGAPADCLVGGNAGPSEFTDWVAAGKPACWCYRHQCRGDIDGLKFGPFQIQLADLNAFKLAFNKFVLPPGGICADNDHKKLGPFRVQLNDLNVFKTYFNKFVVPQCDAAPVVTGPYNFWTN